MRRPCRSVAEKLERGQRPTRYLVPPYRRTERATSPLKEGASTSTVTGPTTYGREDDV